jgi:hypothetical protein
VHHHIEHIYFTVGGGGDGGGVINHIISFYNLVLQFMLKNPQ